MGKLPCSSRQRSSSSVEAIDPADSTTSRARFPGGLRVALKEGDRAVYIGTLRYHRNEFFDITDVAVVDDYAAANAEYMKKFGNGVSLRKALMVLPKSGPGTGKRVVFAPN